MDDDDLCLIQTAMEWAKLRIERAEAEYINNRDPKTHAWICLRIVQLLDCLPSVDTNMPDDFRARIDTLAKKYAPNANRGSA